jgi:sugar phosphate permease
MSRGGRNEQITPTPPRPAVRSLQRPTWVRYQVLAVACSLALLTYLQRLGFTVGLPAIKRDLGLDDAQAGYLAAATLVAYGLFQVPGGLLGDWIGGRLLLSLLVLGWSLLTAAIALTIYLPAGWLPFVFLLGVRFVFSLFQAGGFPALARVLADWMPTQERGFAQGMVWTCSRLGGAVVPFIFLGLSWALGGWALPFWVLGGLGVLWCAFFWLWFRNRPEEMPQVNDAERELIASGRLASRVADVRLPWFRFLGSLNVWGLCLMYGFVGFSGNFITSLLPVYLRDHRHLDERATAWLSGLPLLCGIISCLLGGSLSDLIIRRTGSRTWGRRLVGFVSLACAGLSVLLTLWVDETWLLAILFSAMFFFNDANMGPSWASCADVGERYAGTLSGAMNMVGAFAGAAGMTFAGQLFKRDQDVTVFVIFAGSYTLAALCWLVVDVTRPLVPREPPLPVPAGDGIYSAAGSIQGKK